MNLKKTNKKVTAILTLFSVFVMATSLVSCKGTQEAKKEEKKAPATVEQKQAAPKVAPVMPAPAPAQTPESKPAAEPPPAAGPEPAAVPPAPPAEGQQPAPPAH